MEANSYSQKTILQRIVEKFKQEIKFQDYSDYSDYTYGDSSCW